MVKKTKIKKQKYLCIVAARMGSVRLPGKVLMKVGNLTLLEYLIKRIKFSRNIDKIIVATGNLRSNDKIEKICQKIGIGCFRGSEDDVLDRYYKCSLENPQYNYIIRLTADNPLVDPYVIDELIDFSRKNPKYDYVSNDLVRTFPYGMDVEIFKSQALTKIARETKDLADREHVTRYIKNSKKFKKKNIKCPHDLSHLRLTVDYKEDFNMVKFLIKKCKITDPYLAYIILLSKYPKLFLKY